MVRGLAATHCTGQPAPPHAKPPLQAIQGRPDSLRRAAAAGVTFSTAAGMAEWRMRVSSHRASSGWDGSSPYMSRYDTCEPGHLRKACSATPAGFRAQGAETLKLVEQRRLLQRHSWWSQIPVHPF